MSQIDGMGAKSSGNYSPLRVVYNFSLAQLDSFGMNKAFTREDDNDLDDEIERGIDGGS
jgi:hypothetical protein